MATASLCLVLFLLLDPSAATLSIIPNRSQFFRYEQITLTCAGKEPVKRSTSSKKSEPCKGSPDSDVKGFGDPREASCMLKDTYPSDSGVYWCESEGGKKPSKMVNITVAVDTVILESPALPVMKGEEVTLRCSYKDRYAPRSTSDFSATFYRNNVFIGTEPQGKMTLKAQEGFYKCQHPTKGESPQSLLAVISEMDAVPITINKPQVAPVLRTPPSVSPPPMSLTTLLCIILVFILYTAIIIVSVYAYRRWSRVRAERRIYEHLTMQS